MSLLKRNVAANFLGRAFAAAMFLAATPLYIQFLGIEAFGIIGLFTTLSALSAAFDLGISTSANRELARLTAQEGRVREARNLVRTLEIPFWLSAVGLGVAAALVAGAVARHWLQVEGMTEDEAARAMQLMAVVLAIQFPITFYSGCLQGLQRQVLLNAVNITGTACQVGGVLLALWLYSADLTVFFVWQGIARGAHTVVLGLLVWRSLPRAAAPARFCLAQVRRIWRFTAGMGAISIIGLLLLQVDNLILSRLLPLGQFGYYTLAKTAAYGLSTFVFPVFMAMFPHLTQLVATGDESRLRQSYHRTSQAFAVAVIPCALVIAMFAEELLWAWTGDAGTAGSTALVTGLLVLGMGLNGILHAPHALLLAHGWTRFVFRINAGALLFLIPATLYLAAVHGAVGAAAAWLAVNVGLFLLTPPILHRTLLKGAARQWYLHDCGRPFLAALAIVAAARIFLPPIDDRFTAIALLGLVSGAAMLASALAVPWLRAQLTRHLTLAPSQPAA